MEDKKYRLSSEPSLALPVAALDKLIDASDGTAALLYLYALRCGGFAPQDAARALKRTEAEITKAAAVLCGLKLFSQGEISPALPLPADELPEYTAEDLAIRTGENGEFRAVVEESQRILGHMLTGAELKLLFGLYDYLRLPAEVIVLLVNHCVEEARERLGPGKVPSMKSIEKEAYVWYNRELLTLERAEAHLLRKRARSGALNEIRRLLQIKDRTFSPTERKYAESWLDMDFSLEAIALAYDKTVVKTGALKWPYMNSILQSWHSKNLHSLEEITRGDLQQTYQGRNNRAESIGPVGERLRDDAELMRKLLDRSKGG